MPETRITKLPPVTVSTNKALRTIDAARMLKMDKDKFLLVAKRAGLKPATGRHGSSMWSEADVEVVRAVLDPK